MRILQIFNRYVHRGGEEIVVEKIADELSSHHEFREVIFDSNEWSNKRSLGNRFCQLLSMLWSRKSIQQVRSEVDSFQPDIIILHNIMPIGSAGLYWYLVKCGVPVVHYIHNFRPFSVSGYCWANEQLCPDGLHKNFLPEIIAGAWQDSRAKTAWYAMVLWLLHFTGVYRKVSGWIAISNFMKESFIKGGIEASKIEVISHGWKPQCDDQKLAALAEKTQPPNILYLGRLSEAKGLRVLLEAWESFQSSGKEGSLTIAGDGPLADEIQEFCNRTPNAKWVGFTEGDAKQTLLQACTALVVPSVWWEPLGLVLYEAYDYGKPVIAARSGGIMDHVEDGKSGWMHDPGDSAMLARHMTESMSDPHESRKRGAYGRKLLKDRNNDAWIHQFNSFANRVIDSSSKKNGQKTDRKSPQEALNASIYLADQNPGHDRSFGISRMTLEIMTALKESHGIEWQAITSSTSQQAPSGVKRVKKLPWPTRHKWIRLLTDHFHPLLLQASTLPHLHYYPKGYLPWLSVYCTPSVVTIHDTIIQYDEDHYPRWRSRWEYSYWEAVLRHTLRKADRILTVSEFSKSQIEAFMGRHNIPRKEITVTYEPCAYESLDQPSTTEKKDYYIHLASIEPHKRTAQLIRWWCEAEQEQQDMLPLHLIGTVPEEVKALVKSSKKIVMRPFLDDSILQATYREAKALILPSEIEGFGLPALEAYYLGTPVCYMRGTSVEEILSPATNKGGFTLDDRNSMFSAIREVEQMSPSEIQECGLKLRSIYAAEKVADRILTAFREVARAWT